MSGAVDKAEQFPMDWDGWQAIWYAWVDEREQAGALRRSRYRFPPRNILADSVLGIWLCQDRHVELSAVTMPDFNLGANDRIRYVGITFENGAPEHGLVRTFAELEHELGMQS